MDRAHAHGPRHERGPRHWQRGEHRQRFAMKLAERLAAAEVAIGVKSDQLDTWRAFTAAAVDFVTPPERRGPKPDAQAGEQTATPSRGVLGMADRMADRAIERAEKGKALKAATDALRQKLTPEQLAKLDQFALGPRHGPHGGRRHGPDGPRRHGSER
ncbi:hypothetical protein GCM10008170_21610 [Methylopila capsulata]|nr:hypothetical protein GCM10008170_21610 [Methylopila capsulata]